MQTVTNMKKKATIGLKYMAPVPSRMRTRKMYSRSIFVRVRKEGGQRSRVLRLDCGRAPTNTREIPKKWHGNEMSSSTLPSTEWQSATHFFTEHITKRKPALFKRGCLGWRINKDDLGSIGHVQVPVSLGGCEETTTGNRQSRKIVMPFNQFLTSLHEGTCHGYLKQFDLSQHPTLRNQVLPEQFFPPMSLGTCNLWVGSEGSSNTGLHNDDENNVLCQISGQKHVVLIPPKERPYLYVNSLYDSGTECCDVDASDPNLNVHPLFSNVTTIYSIVLNPGDVLFIPKYWYHQVRPKGPVSISVNYFNSSFRECVRYGCMRWCFDVLHRCGLYKKGHCVCHNA